MFEIKATSSGIDKNKLNGKLGSIPYITRTDRNNGIDHFIDEQEKYTLNQGNIISIGLDTQTVFYQKSYFYTGQNIQILSHEKLNYYNANFIIQILKIQLEKFNWGGNGATLTRLKRSKLVLPVDANNDPDWKFMERYMQYIDVKQTKKVLASMMQYF